MTTQHAEQNIAIATAYYTAFGHKNSAEMRQYLHPDAELIGPLGGHQKNGAILEAAERFFPAFQSLTIRAQLSNADQAIVVFDLEFPAPIGLLRSASFLTIKEGLIARIELFFDASPFRPQ